ncbi:MAG: YybH family protein [Chloroflexota bacterium]
MNLQPGLSLAQRPAPSAGDHAPLGERLAATPRLACEALCGAINQGDVEAALACFAPGAALVWSDGSTAAGEQAIRARLQELISAGAEVQIELRGVLVAQDTALAHERWQISHDGVPDARLAHSPAPSLVLRCLGGEWRIAIAAPWGQAASPPLEAVWP